MFGINREYDLNLIWCMVFEQPMIPGGTTRTSNLLFVWNDSGMYSCFLVFLFKLHELWPKLIIFVWRLLVDGSVLYAHRPD